VWLVDLVLYVSLACLRVHDTEVGTGGSHVFIFFCAVFLTEASLVVSSPRRVR
jgi:hypothetical protein